MHSAWNCCKFTTGGFLISLRTHLLQWVAISLGTCMFVPGPGPVQRLMLIAAAKQIF